LKVFAEAAHNAVPVQAKAKVVGSQGGPKEKNPAPVVSTTRDDSRNFAN
jgi:hypothetical protein